MRKVYELKVFKNGGSNAVRIPVAINIPTDKLFLVVDERGRMTLELKDPKPMSGFFALLDQLEAEGKLESPQNDKSWEDFQEWRATVPDSPRRDWEDWEDLP
jgi:virulence-associated protein VagC